MSFLVIAILATIGLYVALGLVRVALRRSLILPEGYGPLSFIAHWAVFAAWFALLVEVSDGASPLVILEAGFIVWLGMKIAGLLLIQFVGPEHPKLRLAVFHFTGRDPRDFDPRVRRVRPLESPFVEAVARLDAANDRFPRGAGFIAATGQPGFESDWSALDEANRALDTLVTESALPPHPEVAHRMADVASRLQTLRGGSSA
jgi:hypothetical protein